MSGTSDLVFRWCAHGVPIGERCPACAAEDFEEARAHREDPWPAGERDLIYEASECAAGRLPMLLYPEHAQALFVLIHERGAEINRLARRPRICPECAASIREALERAEDEMPEAEWLGEGRLEVPRG